MLKILKGIILNNQVKKVGTAIDDNDLINYKQLRESIASIASIASKEAVLPIYADKNDK